ncbi:MAG TPA: hypothetical protein VMS74_07375 [Acidimicrobiia bacterium]|nr:hypothetical protein [Acidimicrobiia bacterium]
MDHRDADTAVVPALLRSRLALVALFVVFLIPVTQSSLRGLTHVLSCTERVDTPFQVILLEDTEPIVTGSSVVTAGEDSTLCGGLAVQIGAGPSESADIDVVVTVDNTSSNDWFGTVEIDVVGVRVPVDIGRIDSGTSEERRISLALPEGVTEFGGSLLVGP